MVYIDCLNAKFGRMIMCHMVADTREELLAMCLMIGVNVKWLQDKDQYTEHFDICLSKKKLAIEKFGAKEIGLGDMGRFLNARKQKMKQ